MGYFVAFLQKFILCVGVLVLGIVASGRWINPPMTHTMWVAQSQFGSIQHEWIPLEDVGAPVLHSIVASEDLNLCDNLGFNPRAILHELRRGAKRGASSITQQTVKNVFLWQERSWTRKGIEAILTMWVELTWPKHRILEVYVNMIEYDAGVFGIQAASWHYFDKAPAELSLDESLALATVLPSPKTRDARSPTESMVKRAALVGSIVDRLVDRRENLCFADPDRPMGTIRTAWAG